MSDARFALILHTVVVMALLTAYVVVTVLDKDGNTLLGLLGGYVGGAGVQAASRRTAE